MPAGIDGCSMGGSLSIIHLIRSENAVVCPVNLTFYKRFVNDISTKRNKNTEDILFKNQSLTIEVNPKKFLDNKIVLNKDGTVTTFV